MITSGTPGYSAAIRTRRARSPSGVTGHPMVVAPGPPWVEGDRLGLGQQRNRLRTGTVSGEQQMVAVVVDPEEVQGLGDHDEIVVPHHTVEMVGASSSRTSSG